MWRDRRRGGGAYPPQAEDLTASTGAFVAGSRRPAPLIPSCFAAISPEQAYHVGCDNMSHSRARGMALICSPLRQK